MQINNSIDSAPCPPSYLRHCKEVVMVGDENGKRGSVWRKKMESSGGGLDFGFYGERWPQPDTLDYF